MRIVDSRRLTGPNLLLDGPGAILDIALEGVDPESAIAAWRAALSRLLEAVGWQAVPAARVHAQGLSLAFPATLDVLYAATEVNETAWSLACETLGTPPAVPPESFPSAVERLRETIATERNPWLVVLAEEAHRRGVTLLADDRRISVGLGRRSQAWPAEETPRAVDRIRWAKLSDVPVALVTGTNGKTTTVRLLGTMAAAAGRMAGVTSTDRVTVGDEVVAVGDYSGPNGARTVLRDRRVEIAMLEVARGGILRRGLALPRVQAALVTNVANDHLGEYGIFDLPSLADVKLVVAKAVPSSGRVVLNADDPLLLERGARVGAPVTWFTLDPTHPDVAAHRARGGEACVLEGETLVFYAGRQRHEIAAVSEIPAAFGGAARYNVANALGAIGVAVGLGLPAAAVREGLLRFETDRADNPGRANVWELGGVRAIVDFAHNPHGLAAIAQLATALPARRRAIVVGQAGDRDDEAIRELARAAASMRPDHVFLKEMESFFRGRERGVVSALIAEELAECGVPSAAMTRCETELDAVRAALAWARDGDLLLLTVHAQRDEVTEQLESLAREGWRPGAPIAPTSS